MNKDELLNSPYRTNEQLDTPFSEVYIIPLEEMHESGFNMIAIVGVIKKLDTTKSTIDTNEYSSEYLLCSKMCDDLSTFFPPLDLGNDLTLPCARMDCVPPSGILRYHSGLGHFTVSESLSSMEIHFHLASKYNEKKANK